MEFLIWLIILFVINSVFGSKPKKMPGNPNLPGRPTPPELPEMPEESLDSHRVDDYDLPDHSMAEYIEPEYTEPEQPSAPVQKRPRVKVYGGLGDLLLDIQKELTAAENAEAAKQQRRAGRRAERRRRSEEATVAVQAATVQKEEAAEETAKPVTVSAAQPIVLAATESRDVPVTDLAALRQQMQLSEVQAGLLWQEILDKPVALRRGARR